MNKIEHVQKCQKMLSNADKFQGMLDTHVISAVLASCKELGILNIYLDMNKAEHASHSYAADISFNYEQ